MKWIACVTLIFLAGCATKPVSISHTHTGIDVELSRQDSDDYFLTSDNGRALRKISGDDGSLHFDIPGHAGSSQCYRITNAVRKTFVPLFRLPLVDDYAQAESIHQSNAS